MLSGAASLAFITPALNEPQKLLLTVFMGLSRETVLLLLLCKSPLAEGLYGGGSHVRGLARLQFGRQPE